LAEESPVAAAKLDVLGSVRVVQTIEKLEHNVRNYSAVPDGRRYPRHRLSALHEGRAASEGTATMKTIKTLSLSAIAAVALSAAAVAPALAHDAIVPRADFNTALASIQPAPSAQAQPQAKPQAQASSDSQSEPDVTAGDHSGDFDITQTLFSSDRWLKAND
jgi:hypothetical protein